MRGFPGSLFAAAYWVKYPGGSAQEAAGGTTHATPLSRNSRLESRLWTGRVISTILVLFLLLDAIAKILRVPQVLQAFIQLGWSPGFAVPIGITLLTCTLIYAIPQTSPFGVLLLNAYLGGAVATHLRAGQPFYFPILFGILLWVGLVLRNDRLRILLPLQD